jgi:hypothetical protein
MGKIVLEGPAGSRIPAQVRVRGFDNGAAKLDLAGEDKAPPSAPAMTPELERVLQAIRDLVPFLKTNISSCCDR